MQFSCKIGDVKRVALYASRRREFQCGKYHGKCHVTLTDLEERHSEDIWVTAAVGAGDGSGSVQNGNV